MKRIALICWLSLGLAPMIPAANTTWGPAEIDVEITTGTLSVEWTGFERANRIMSPLKLWKIDWSSNPDGDVTFETDQIQGRLAWLVTNPDDGATSP
ncbi:MAG TPA: hypothetical protein PLS90_14420, partial [Candidatus Sumerlaeota bacterium]|nr:hypothetical protein [Candidatus Sumerlaeota bacterium]HPK03639.1 hypothetical protein [Candidatus Sumerlaeota bacterium]